MSSKKQNEAKTMLGKAKVSAFNNASFFTVYGSNLSLKPCQTKAKGSSGGTPPSPSSWAKTKTSLSLMTTFAPRLTRRQLKTWPWSFWLRRWKASNQFVPNPLQMSGTPRLLLPITSWTQFFNCQRWSPCSTTHPRSSPSSLQPLHHFPQ